jgi:hypothetical protein
MNTAFVTTKYATWKEASKPMLKKASAWVREHRVALSWTTSLTAVAAVAAVLSAHGGWSVLAQTQLVVPWAVWAVLALWPVNMGLEVAKWHRLSSAGGARPWREAWREVLAGQTWALLGPFRLADGAGRLAASRADHLRSVEGAKAYGWGAAAQGWATWAWAIPALAMWGWHSAAALTCLVVGGAAAVLLRGGAGGVVLALSLSRYAVFAAQYLLCLVGWGALAPDTAWVEGFPRIAAVWCATSSIPWPAELGVREAAALWAFDENLPSVVVATFVLWAINRVSSAAVGAFFLVPKP